jgi:hypothetical protein
VLGGLGALALVPGVACSNNDKQVFSGATPSTRAGGGGGSTTVGSAPTTTASRSATATSTPPSTTKPKAAVTDPFPSGAALQVNFTYTMVDQGGPPGRNPYIAVWIEDPQGHMVQTLSVWFQARQSQYVEHLTRWYNAEAALLDGGGTNNLDTRTGATRVAGAYQVVWDGTDTDGRPVAKGDYVVCVEAAREHGPESLSTAAVTIGTKAFTTKLPDDSELSALAAVFVV